MAAYHCNVKIVSRGKGQSAIAKAAYNARARIRDEQTGELKDYSRGGDAVMFAGIFAPTNAPQWAHDRAKLWNQVEAMEHRKDAQLARSLVFALPHELTDDQRRQLATDFARENFARKGMVADVVIHAPDEDGDQRNYHAHVLLTTREIGPNGFGAKNRDWNRRDLVNEWKDDIAEKGARMLDRAGYEVEAQRFRWGHLTNEQQRERAIERGDLEFAEAKSREPTTHDGPNIREIERRGEISYVQVYRGERDREVTGRTAIDEEIPGSLAALRAQRSALERQISAYEGLVKYERELNETAGNVRLAYCLADSHSQFQEQMAQHGLWLARVTHKDASASVVENSHAKTRGQYTPVLRAGDYVAINNFGHIYTLDERTTGESSADVKAFLCQLDGEKVPGVAETRAEFAPQRRERDATVRETRAHDHPGDDAVAGLLGGLNKAGNVAGKMLGQAAQAMEEILTPLLDFGAGPLDPKDEQARAVDRTERAERKAAERLDFARYQSDAEYRREIEQRRQQEQQERTQEDYRKRDRDR